MSGHSKWATIKHKKGAADKKRAKIFAKLIKQVEVAAREGGGDLDANASLRTMYQKARDASVPLDTIERAVKRGTGELEGVSYEPIAYEGYAPAGVALYIDVLTDNRNRSGSEVRSMLSKNGGSLAEPGAVSWQFDRKGVVLLPKGDHDEDDLMMIALEAGAEDLTDVGEAWQLTCEPTDLNGLRDAVAAAEIEITSADLVMVPQQTIELDESDAKSVLRLIEVLEDNDDVQDVYANFDISEEVMAALTAD